MTLEGETSGALPTVEEPEAEKAAKPKTDDIKALKHKAEKAVQEKGEIETSLQAKIDDAETRFDEARNRALQAEARVSSLEEELEKSSGSVKELDEVKQQLEAATKSSEELATKALEFRKAALVSSYGITPDTVEEIKSLVELDNFEVALKAVTSKGIGNYAVGGGGGAATPEETPLERASRIIQEAEKSGHVIGGGGSSFKTPEKD